MEDSPFSRSPGKNRRVLVATAGLLITLGGLLAWRLAPSPPSMESTDATSLVPQPLSEEPANTLEADETEEPETSSAAGAVCREDCRGTLSSEGLEALRAKGEQASGCYHRARRQRSPLTGKLNLRLRVAPSGNVCSFEITESSLKDPAVTSCVTQMFRSARFPAPEGGCVEANIPLHFNAAG